MSKKKQPLVLDKQQLEIKSTKELLGYLKNLNKCVESFEFSDMDLNLDALEPDNIYFKQTAKWINAHKLAKEILNTREHLQKPRN
jgi:superoxide dismutase